MKAILVGFLFTHSQRHRMATNGAGAYCFVVAPSWGR